jgi:hypothetical protein
MSEMEAFALTRAAARTGLEIKRGGLNKYIRDNGGTLRHVCDGWCLVPDPDPEQMFGTLHVFEVEDTSKMSHDKIMDYAYASDAVCDEVRLHVLNRYGDEVSLIADPELCDMAIDYILAG